MVFLSRSLYIVYQHHYRERKKNQLSPVENRVRKICVSIMGEIYDLQPLIFSEVVAESPDVTSSVNALYLTHFMVIHI